MYFDNLGEKVNEGEIPEICQLDLEFGIELIGTSSEGWDQHCDRSPGWKDQGHVSRVTIGL